MCRYVLVKCLFNVSIKVYSYRSFKRFYIFYQNLCPFKLVNSIVKTGHLLVKNLALYTTREGACGKCISSIFPLHAQLSLPVFMSDDEKRGGVIGEIAE